VSTSVARSPRISARSTDRKPISSVPPAAIAMITTKTVLSLMRVDIFT